MTRPFAFGALAALLLVAGCGPLVQIGGNAKPPVSLLTLRATAAPLPYAGPAKLADSIGVDLPVVPGALQTLRLPVTTSDSEITYLVGATWAEQPNRQFQRLLADTLAARGLAVIDSHQSAASPARTLSGTLRECGLDVRSGAIVRIRYDAQLASPGNRSAPLALRRFEVTEAAGDQRPAAIAAALNRAANRIAAEVADWAKSGG